MNDTDKEWIDNATYTQLLKRWRFSAFDDEIFQSEKGEYYSKVMSEKKAELSNEDQVQASKNIGW